MPTATSTRPAPGVNRATSDVRASAPARVWQIARAEGRRLVRHPLTLVGLALSAWMIYEVTRPLVPLMERDIVRLAATAAPLMITTLLVTHLATTRPRRDDTGELFATAPVPPSMRTAGLLVACMWPAALGLMFALAGTGYLYAIGGIGTPDLFDVAAIPAAVATAGVIGVALGRWVPSRIAATIAAIVLIGAHLWMDGNVIDAAGGNISRLMLHADWGASMALGPELLPRSPDLHLAYVAGLVAIVAAAAIARHRRHLGVLMLGAGGAALVVLTAGQLLEPIPDARADEMITLISDPSDELTCQTRDQVDYCMLEHYTPWIDVWHPTIAGVLERLPANQRPERLRVELDLSRAAFDLEGVLSGRRHDIFELHDASGRRDADTIYVGPILRRGAAGDKQRLGLALSTSAFVLEIGGLVTVDNPDVNQEFDPEHSDRPPPDELEVPCTTVGQAREVVALYLAGRSSAAAERGLRREVDRHSYGFDTSHPGGVIVWRDRLDVGHEFPIEERITSWSLAGAIHAQHLVDRPDDQVLTRLQEDWSRWTSPGTTRQELLDEFDLEALPTLQEAAAQTGIELPDESSGPYVDEDAPQMIFDTAEDGSGASCQ